MATKTRKMKPAVKRKWVKALESGKYRQGKSALRTVGNDRSNYCCLGVLCELYRQDTGKGEWIREDGEWTFKATPRADEEGATLPAAVSKWAGLGKECNPDVLVESDWIGETAPMPKSLSDVNDDGTKFRDIAKLIKEHL